MLVYGRNWGFPAGLPVKNPPANEGDTRYAGLIPGSRRSPGGGHGNTPQSSSLENSMDRGAWQTMVHSVTKSWTRLKWLSTHAWQKLVQCCKAIILQIKIKRNALPDAVNTQCHQPGARAAHTFSPKRHFVIQNGPLIIPWEEVC